MKTKKKTIYGLRIRFSDNEDWREPEYYQTKKERDRVEKFNRIIGGLRTWSFEERKPIDEIEAMF